MSLKKILTITALAGFFAFMCYAFSYAVDTDVWVASHTATADTTKNLCPGVPYSVASSSFAFTTYTEGNHGVFHGACVNGGVAATTLTVYNSSATATGVIPIAIIQTSTTMPCSLYDVAVSSGLTYTTSGTADISILYQCY